MTTPDHEPGIPSVREPDNKKIDRIAAYVDEQRKSANNWTHYWGTFTVYTAVAAFFFGIGTWSDLRSRISHPVDEAQKLKDTSVSRLDDSCKDDIGDLHKKKGTGWTLVVADDLEILNARQGMGAVWLYANPAGMRSQDIAAIGSIKSYYFAANSFLESAIDRAKAADRDGYTLRVGLYRQANAAYLKATGDFGFTVCDHYWGLDDAPRDS